MGTFKQKRVVKETIKNLNRDKPLNKGKILDKIGYKKNTVRTPEIVYNTEYVKRELSNVIKELEKNRDLALKSLPNKLKKAQYNHAITGVDVLTKNIQLLSGQATERKETILDDDQKSKIAKELLGRTANNT